MPFHHVVGGVVSSSSSAACSTMAHICWVTPGGFCGVVPCSSGGNAASSLGAVCCSSCLVLVWAVLLCGCGMVVMVLGVGCGSILLLGLCCYCCGYG